MPEVCTSLSLCVLIVFCSQFYPSNPTKLSSEMDIEVLIASVYQRRLIWDKRDKGHANRNIIDQLWKAISIEMGMDGKKARLFDL